MKKAPISAATTSSSQPSISAKPMSQPAAGLPKRKVPLAASRRASQDGKKAESTNGGSHHGNGMLEIDGEQVLGALMSLKRGNFGTRLPLGWTGMAGKVADTFNEVAELMSQSTDELSRI